MSPVDALIVATAISLYGYNVSPFIRAKKLWDHFGGECAELDELVATLVTDNGYAATALATPTALVYVQHAMDQYGVEADHRVRVNLGIARE